MSDSGLDLLGFNTNWDMATDPSAGVPMTSQLPGASLGMGESAPATATAAPSSSSAAMNMPAAAAAGQAITAIGGAIVQSNAMKAAAAYNARMAANQQQLAGFESQQLIGTAMGQAEQEQQAANRMVGTQKSAFAGQGVAVNSGSARMVTSDTQLVGQINANTIMNNAYRQSFGLKAEALNVGNQASEQTLAANYNATQTLLTGGVNAIGSAGMSAFYSKYPYAYGSNPNMRTAQLAADTTPSDSGSGY